MAGDEYAEAKLPIPQACQNTNSIFHSNLRIDWAFKDVKIPATKGLRVDQVGKGEKKDLNEK